MVSVTWHGKRLITHLDRLEQSELYDRSLDPRRDERSLPG